MISSYLPDTNTLLIKLLDNAELGMSKRGEEMFDALFNWNPLSLKVPTENITWDDTQEDVVGEATYAYTVMRNNQVKKSGEIGCLEFTQP